MAWCGWEVHAFDIELGTDLAGDKHAELWKLRGEVLARAWACPCSTFSRARERRLAYSSDGGPPQLRSVEQPKGLAGLSPRDQARVDMDSILACRAAEWAEHSLSDGHTLTIIENPRHSLCGRCPSSSVYSSMAVGAPRITTLAVFRARGKRLRPFAATQA